MSIKKYLSKIQEEKEINKNDRLRCTVCGRQVTVNKKGQGPLVCCGKNMVHLGTVVEAGFSKNPKGWSQDSIKKYSKTFTKNMKGGVKSKGFFDKCVKKMEGKLITQKDSVHLLKMRSMGLHIGEVKINQNQK
jgi:desulfoferrodoxin-like iron-binding protein